MFLRTHFSLSIYSYCNQVPKFTINFLKSKRLIGLSAQERLETELRINTISQHRIAEGGDDGRDDADGGRDDGDVGQANGGQVNGTQYHTPT